MRLSANFDLEEFVFSDYAARNGIDNTPDKMQMANLFFLAKKMEEIRLIVIEPIVITSGFRSKALNKAIGGAPNSAHLDGLAADWYPLTSRHRLLSIARRVAHLLRDYDQLILETYGGGRWIHTGFSGAMRRETWTYKERGKALKGLV